MAEKLQKMTQTTPAPFVWYNTKMATNYMKDHVCINFTVCALNAGLALKNLAPNVEQRFKSKKSQASKPQLKIQPCNVIYSRQ